MENKINKCYNCANLLRFYTKGTKSFDKTKIGRCCNKQCIVSTEDSCENFSAKPKIRRRDRLIKYVLCDLLTEISEIRKYLEAENDKGEKL